MTLKGKMGLGAGLAALLPLAMLAAVYLGLSMQARMELAERAMLDAQITEQRLTRTLNELLLSGGASAARTQARLLLPQLDAALKKIAATDVPEVKESIDLRVLPLWSRIRPLAEALLAQRTLSPEEAQDQIALGKIMAVSDKLSAELQAALVKTDQHLAARRVWIHGVALAGGVLAAAISLLLMLYMHRAVQSSLGGAPEHMALAVGSFASGDLVAEVPVRKGDATSAMAALGRMRGALTESVRTIRQSSEAIGLAAQEIAQGHANLSSRTEQQASSLEQTAASMEQMSATVSQNAENAKKASQHASAASEVAARGGQAVGAVVSTMTGISASSKKISDIIAVIDGIAFQTNILALNAAVEAARAGEQGRGFAVVASEVRSLAQRSAAAAKEIRQLIADSVGRIDSGSRQVAEAGATMNEIVDTVKRVNGLIAEISAASQEQSQSLTQVTDTVQQLEKVTQQNAAMVEQATAASASLEDQADALIRAVAAFKLDSPATATGLVGPAARAGRNPLPALLHLRA